MQKLTAARILGVSFVHLCSLHLMHRLLAKLARPEAEYVITEEQLCAPSIVNTFGGCKLQPTDLQDSDRSEGSDSGSGKGLEPPASADHV